MYVVEMLVVYVVVVTVVEVEWEGSEHTFGDNGYRYAFKRIVRYGDIPVTQTRFTENMLLQFCYCANIYLLYYIILYTLNTEE